MIRHPLQPRHPRLSGAVLAGGRARRMGGADKALLTLTAGDASLGGNLETRDSGARRTILSKILQTFQERFAETILVTSRTNRSGADYSAFAARVVADAFEDCGPLGGIHAALTTASTPLVFVAACDMPNLSGPLIDFMAADAVRAGRADAGRLLVPVVGGRPEPLHAIYPRSILLDVDQALRDGVRKMSDFLERVPVDWLTQVDFGHIEGALASFRNVNTPEDLEACR